MIAYVDLVLLVVLGTGQLLQRIRARWGVGWSVLRAILILIAAIVSVFPVLVVGPYRKVNSNA